nr:uncharacterized protein LOC102590628 [Ipomoea batatas]
MEGREVSYNNKDADARSESPEVVLFQRRCCFCFPCFGSANRGGLRWWHKQHQHQLGGEVEEKSLLSRGISALKKLREWQGKFQYDPLDYSLNFDQGPGNLEEETEYAYRNFSVRYASIPASAKASMDLARNHVSERAVVAAAGELGSQKLFLGIYWIEKQMKKKAFSSNI